ncbi:hypothetical protein ACFV1L_30390 [Kitasatospora sp. NPDC059646]|uniref:hypothetical protein n=1 Tax=Kitasatospora sp. NPDC059646 TaxID=3346893 RepID=UPI0036858548
MERWNADLASGRAAQDAVDWFCGGIAARARECFPAEEQWLERACWPADPLTVPLGEFSGSLWPPVLVERLVELRAIAARAWLAPKPAATAVATAA